MTNPIRGPFNMHRQSLVLAAAMALLSGTARCEEPPLQADSTARKVDAHAFDFEIGTWRTKLKRLKAPLSGSTTWLEYEGTTVVTKILGGRANLVELVAEGKSGSFEGISLRLYEPGTRQWTLNFANLADGTLATPMIGAFADGRGVFYNQERYQGRAILVRFFIEPVDANEIRFEQAFSADGGNTWEVNWIAVDTRTTG